MPSMTFREAVRRAMNDALASDSRVVLMGEDIGPYGGAFKVTAGLHDRFGPRRIIETPISENSFAGVAVGAAMCGLRPIVEFMFMDFMTLAMDQICNHAAKISYMYAGQCDVPVVFRAPFGGGFGYGASHSQSLESWFMHTPGLKVVVPSTPASARALLEAAIRDDGPVIFLEHKALYNLAGDVPEVCEPIEIGRAHIVRPGADITVAAYGRTVRLGVEAAKRLKPEIDLEIIDLRSIAPLDVAALTRSVEKTGRLMIVTDDCRTAGVGAEVGAVVTERVPLQAPLARVACADVPLPCCEPLERAALPSVKRVEATAARMMEGTYDSGDRAAEGGRQRDPRESREMACTRG